MYQKHNTHAAFSLLASTASSHLQWSKVGRWSYYIMKECFQHHCKRLTTVSAIPRGKKISSAPSREVLNNSQPTQFYGLYSHKIRHMNIQLWTLVYFVHLQQNPVNPLNGQHSPGFFMNFRHPFIHPCLQR